MSSSKEFLLDLANVLEKHKVNIVSPNDSKDPKVFSHVAFQRYGEKHMFPTLERCHVSAYDLRCEAGMSSQEANDLYKLIKRIKE